MLFHIHNFVTEMRFYLPPFC